MSKKALGETEKTILVGGAVVAFWLGIDMIAKRAETKDAERLAERRDAGVARSRRRDRQRGAR